MHVQVRLGAARQHDPQAGGPPGDEQLQPPQRLRRLQLVQIIDHQHQRLFDRTKVLQHPLDHGLAAKPGCRADPLDGAADSPRERVDHRQPEVLRVSFARLDRDPRRPLRDPAVLEPRAHQHRLAAARGSADENHTVGRGRRQLLEQRLATHQPPVAGRPRTGRAGPCRLPLPVPISIHREPVSPRGRRRRNGRQSGSVRGGPIDWVLRTGRNCAV